MILAVLGARRPARWTQAERAVLLKLHGAGEHSIAELAELLSVRRATVYREIARTPAKKSDAGVR